jgi:predicted transposase YbfD/YdcC
MVMKCLSITTYFDELEDPRIDRTKRHLLVDIICLSVCAVIAGAEGWEDIEEFGLTHEAWLRKFLRLPNGIPSHDTISRVFRRLKPKAFESCFLEWVTALHEQLGFKLIAIDGKTLRRSHDRRTMKSALHVVCAWSVENHIVLGQEAVDQKSNEITAIPELLRTLDLKGAVVTIDAMGCQKEIAKQIVEADGDYLLAVKENQPSLLEALREHFLRMHEGTFGGVKMTHRVTHETSHGREEERHYYMTPIPAALREQLSPWVGCQSVGQAISYVTRDGKQTDEVRFYIGSFKSNVRRFADAVRGHWGIENSMHWVLDMTFREDESRIRKDHGPDNFAILRRIALTLIKRDTSRGSVRRKRKRAAWSNQTLLNILLSMA